MNTSAPEERPAYTTPPRVQAWFLKRSRDLWKKKYRTLKGDAKRLENRARDVGKSRERWREQSGQLTRRVEALEAANAALREQLAALKKDG